MTVVLWLIVRSPVSLLFPFVSFLYIVYNGTFLTCISCTNWPFENVSDTRNPYQQSPEVLQVVTNLILLLLSLSISVIIRVGDRVIKYIVFRGDKQLLILLILLKSSGLIINFVSWLGKSHRVRSSSFFNGIDETSVDFYSCCLTTELLVSTLKGETSTLLCIWPRTWSTKMLWKFARSW